MKKTKTKTKNNNIIVVAILVFMIVASMTLNVLATSMTGITSVSSFESENTAAEGEMLTEDQVKGLNILQSSPTESTEESVKYDGSDGIIVEADSTTDISGMNALIDSIRAQGEGASSTDENHITTDGAEEAESYLDEGMINDDYYSIQSGKVTVDQYIKGNVYIIADEVEFNAGVSGNTFVIAEKITHNSRVIGSIYDIADDITFNTGAYVTGSVYALSNNFKAYEGAIFNSDARVISGESFDINSTIFRNLFVLAEDVNLGEKLFIKTGGNISYSGTLNDSSQGYRELIHKVENVQEKATQVKSFTESVRFSVLRYVSALILIIFISMVSYRFRLRYDNLGRSHVNKAGAKGVIHIILVPIISILFLVSIIGMSVGLILITLWCLITFVLARPSLCLYFARRILKTDDSCFINFVKEVLLATAIFVAVDLIGMIPVVGALARIITTIWGYGIVICSFEGLHHKKCGCHGHKEDYNEKNRDEIDNSSKEEVTNDTKEETNTDKQEETDTQEESKKDAE